MSLIFFLIFFLFVSYIVFNFLLPVAEGLQRMVRSRVCRGTVLAIRRGSVSLCFGSSYTWRKQHWEIRIMAQIYRALKYQCRSWDQAMLMLNSKLNIFFTCMLHWNKRALVNASPCFPWLKFTSTGQKDYICFCKYKSCICFGIKTGASFRSSCTWNKWMFRS